MMITTRHHVALLAALLPLALLRTADAQPADYVHRDFVIDASVVSYLPDKGIEGYNQHGSGITTARASLGLGMRMRGVSATIKIIPRVAMGRLHVVIDLEPGDAKRSLGFEQQTLDVTDLKPAAIRLAADENGRVFQLNLTPSVRVSDNTPQHLDVSELQLHHWRFPDSPVLVNDALYVGRISCAQSPVAFVDISGVARAEFSLYELTEAKPWGVLNHGVVTLTNPDDQTTIQISNVLNGGPHAVELPGGPYRIWVRWSAPTHTVEQHRKELVELRKRILGGEFPSTAAAYLDKQLAREPSPWLHSSGVRGLRSGEWVNQAD